MNQKMNVLDKTGGNVESSKRSMWGVIGLAVLSTIYTVSYYAFSIPDTTIGIYLLVLVGVVLAGVSAYWERSLFLSWALVLGAASGPIVVFGLLRVQETQYIFDRTLPFLVIPLGVPIYWIPTALILGNIAFGVGAVVRWTGDR